MALGVKTLKDEKEKAMKGWEANRDLYLDKEGNVVEAGDPYAAFLLARAGRVIPEAQMNQYGVKKKAPGKAKAKAEDKAEDKAVRKKGDKGG